MTYQTHTFSPNCHESISANLSGKTNRSALYNPKHGHEPNKQLQELKFCVSPHKQLQLMFCILSQPTRTESMRIYCPQTSHSSSPKCAHAHSHPGLNIKVEYQTAATQPTSTQTIFRQTHNPHRGRCCASVRQAITINNCRSHNRNVPLLRCPCSAWSAFRQ